MRSLRYSNLQSSRKCFHIMKTSYSFLRFKDICRDLKHCKWSKWSKYLWVIYYYKRISFLKSENWIRNFTKWGKVWNVADVPPERSAMKGGRSAILQKFPLGGRSATLQITGERFAMLQIFRGEGLQCCRPSRGEGLQGGRSAIQHRVIFQCCAEGCWFESR